jgi:hypothetical protein
MSYDWADIQDLLAGYWLEYEDTTSPQERHVYDWTGTKITTIPHSSADGFSTRQVKVAAMYDAYQRVQDGDTNSAVIEVLLLAGERIRPR